MMLIHTGLDSFGQRFLCLTSYALGFYLYKDKICAQSKVPGQAFHHAFALCLKHHEYIVHGLLALGVPNLSLSEAQVPNCTGKNNLWAFYYLHCTFTGE
jgi:hypothetical protein